MYFEKIWLTLLASATASTKSTYQQEWRLCDPVIYKTTYVNTKMSLLVFWNCFDLASTCVSVNIWPFSFACLLPLNLLKHWNDSDAISSYISLYYLLIIIYHLILVSVYSAAASTLCKLSPFLICLPPPFKGFCLKTKIKNKQIIQIWPPLHILI